MHWTISEQVVETRTTYIDGMAYFGYGPCTIKDHGRFETPAAVTEYISRLPSRVHSLYISRWDAITGKIVEQTMAVNWERDSVGG